MKTNADTFFILDQLIRLTDKESQHLLRTTERLKRLKPDLEWVQTLENNDVHSEMLDAFVARFGRLQDTIGDKLLPALLRISLEKTGTQLDNLLRAEKLGWIDSAERWIKTWSLRNRLIHEYMESPEDLLQALLAALENISVLTNAYTGMAKYLRVLQAQTQEGH
jgi:uncharacterized protein YutE (UPF0331/DUF86 family)